MHWYVLFDVCVVVASPSPPLKGPSGDEAEFPDVVTADLCDEFGVSGADPTKLLEGKNIIFSMYSGELATCNTTVSPSKCAAPEPAASIAEEGAWQGATTVWKGGVTQVNSNDEPGPWSGYDIELLEELRKVGGFSYTIVSLGSAVDISTGDGYTATNAKAESEMSTMMTGQGTWRVNLDRQTEQDYIWSTNPVTEEVLFVTRKATEVSHQDQDGGLGLVGEGSYLSRAGYIFEPFKYSVWGMLVGLTILYWLVLTCINWNSNNGQDANLFSEMDAGGQNSLSGDNSGTKTIPIGTLTYNVCISLAAEHEFESHSWFLKVVTMAWVLFIFVITAIYTASLTSFLTLDTTTLEQVTSVHDVIAQDKTFCVNHGSANAAFFTEDDQFRNMKIYGTEGIEEQINCVLGQKGCKARDEYAYDSENASTTSVCDAIELTLEDVYLWAKQNEGDTQCALKIKGEPIVTRQRGMMAKVEHTCLVAAINALYYKLHTQKAAGDSEVTAVSLYQKWFPDTDNCAGVDTEAGHRPMVFSEIIGVWGVLLLFTVGTLLAHFARHRKQCCCYAESKKHWKLSWEEAGFKTKGKRPVPSWPSTKEADSGYYIVEARCTAAVSTGTSTDSIRPTLLSNARAISTVEINN